MKNVKCRMKYAVRIYKMKLEILLTKFDLKFLFVTLFPEASCYHPLQYGAIANIYW